MPVHQNAVNRFEAEGDRPFGPEFYDEQLLTAFEYRFIANIYKSRIKRFCSVTMQPVIGQIIHFLDIQGSDADVFKVLRIVRQCEAQCIDRS